MRLLAALPVLVGLVSAAPSLMFTGGVSAEYDDNIFQYSARDESIFTYRAQPNRFPFRSLDDAVVSATGRLTWRTSLIAGHTSHLGVSAAGHQYVSNPVKSYLSGSVRARQYLAQGLHLDVSYLLIPRYLVRYYHDPRQFTSYVPCTFAEHLIGLAVGWVPARWLELAPAIRYEIDRYQAPFEFYNSTAWRGGIDLRYAPFRAVSLGAAYEFKASRSRAGTNPDVSYDQHDGAVSVKRRLGKAELEVGYDYSWRGYTAAVSLDTTHAGRVDATQAVFAGVTLALTQTISVVGNYRYERRSSVSPYRAEIDEVRDYTQNVIGVGIRVGGSGR